MMIIYVGDSKDVYKRIRTNHCNGNVEASALRRYIAEAMGFKIRRQRRSSGSVRVRIGLPDPHKGESAISTYIYQGKWKILLLEDYTVAHDFQWYLIENLKPLLNREGRQYQTDKSQRYGGLMKQLTSSPFVDCNGLDNVYSGPGIYIFYHEQKPNSIEELDSSKEEIEKRRHQEEYRELIDLLNKLKSRGKISAAQWREYNFQWRESPQERRDDLVRNLKYMLG